MKDYCESCEKEIEQIDLGDGSFGCPLCKSDNHITTYYNSDDEDDVQKRLMELVNSLSDNQFWKYVKSWFDVNDIYETMKNWDTEVQKEAIKEINDLIKKEKKK